MGAAGDMLTAALLELLPEERQKEILAKLQSLFPDKLTITAEKAVRAGIIGTHMRVLVNGAEEVSADVSAETHAHCHGAEHHHDQEHAQEQDHAYDQEHDHAHEPSHDHEHDHDHDHEHDHTHEHGHEHDHEHDQEHGHVHDHDHAHGHHHHTSLAEIRALVAGMDLPEETKSDINAVYDLLAEAESHAHGVPVTEIHFHEVGALDAVADITSVCLLMHELAPEQVLVSAVNAGSGQVRCAHGIMPVPAPAAEYLLRGIPYYQSVEISGELCTPTGAALLRHFGTSFGAQPVMRVEKTGYGMGTKEFEAANCVRAFLGDAEPAGKKTASAPSGTSSAGASDRAVQLEANVDDMTAEEIGFAAERLFDAGAREVFTVPVCMKKSRPGTLIAAICSSGTEDAVIRAMFRYTTTLGIRKLFFERAVLSREMEEVQTPLGTLRVKTSKGYGVSRRKVEYDDAAAIAKKTGKTLREVRKEAEKAQRKGEAN